MSQQYESVQSNRRVICHFRGHTDDVMVIDLQVAAAMAEFAAEFLSAENPPKKIWIFE